MRMTLNNNRCFFDGFNEANDKNPVTYKPGVHYYKFRLLGFLLSKIGFAISLPYEEEGQKKMVYLTRIALKCGRKALK